MSVSDDIATSTMGPFIVIRCKIVTNLWNLKSSLHEMMLKYFLFSCHRHHRGTYVSISACNVGNTNIVFCREILRPLLCSSHSRGDRGNIVRGVNEANFFRGACPSLPYCWLGGMFPVLKPTFKNHIFMRTFEVFLNEGENS